MSEGRFRFWFSFRKLQSYFITKKRIAYCFSSKKTYQNSEYSLFIYFSVDRVLTAFFNER